ncbi:hypothetical protein H9L39_10096 [Fusarium oxysporum f. sp. albedinis]|nr:hypothetical protein H9L39_10096 [Fusarium oxysporum f. sp. albedinis]
MESSTSFPERSFADGARTPAEFFAYIQTHTSIQRAWHRHAIKGQRRAASSTYRRCVSAQNGSNGWPRKHPISMEMFDNVNNETMWMNITYERWFILAGVCRIETLQQECKGIVNAVLARCGDELDKGLAYKHGPDDSKPHFSALLPKCLTRSSSNRRKSIVLSIVDDQSGGSH